MSYNSIDSSMASSFLVILSGLGVLFCIITATYLICMIADRFFGSITLFSPDSHREEDTKVLGLLGLTIEERRRIFNHFLKGKKFSSTDRYQKQKQLENTNKSKRSDSIETEATIESHEDDELDHFSSGTSTEEGTNALDTFDMIGDMFTCAICLSDYEECDEVIESVRCTHMFHKECLLVWLDKKIGCPCCRMPLITHKEMEQAARDTLDRKLCDEILTNNKNLRQSASEEGRETAVRGDDVDVEVGSE